MDTAGNIRTLFFERFAWSGASSAETRELKRLLAKRSTAEIHEAIRLVSHVGSIDGAEDAEAILYSLTEVQVLQLLTALRSVNGWD